MSVPTWARPDGWFVELGFEGRIAVNGCPWPGVSASGSLGYDWWQSISFDTSNDPVTYTGSAITDAAGPVTTVQECVVNGVRKYKKFEWTGAAGDIWISQIEAAPAPGDVITGSWSIGDDGGSWTLTRTN